MKVFKEDIAIDEQNRLFEAWCEKRPVEPRVARPVMADPDVESWFIVAVIGTVLCFLSGVEISTVYVLKGAASSSLGLAGAVAWLVFPGLWVLLCFVVARVIPYVARLHYERKLAVTGWAEYESSRRRWRQEGEALFSQWFPTNDYVATGYDNATA